MDGRKNRKWISLVLAVILAAQLVGCAGKQSGLLLHLGFDEGSGNLVRDTGGSAGEAELAYVLTNTPYNTPQDPQWRKQGVEGGCLLLDGCSNYAAFSSDTILVQGKASETISVRSYSDFHSRAIRLEADENVTIRSIYAAPMRSIYTGI